MGTFGKKQHRRVGAALLLVAGLALADGLAGRFEIRSAALELKEGVYMLDARMHLPVGEAVRSGLAQGVPLAVDLEFVMERNRRWLPDSDVAQLTQRYRLQYNAVSARYVLRNINSGAQSSFATVDAALGYLEQIRDVPVLDRALLSPERHYEASLRAKADFGDVPLTLRILMFWVDDWHRESEWYTWSVSP
jgi:Domain of unknown function (DUF4390)